MKRLSTIMLTAGLLSASLSLPSFASSNPEDQRIISAGGAVTELILALGAQEQLIAVDVTSELPADMPLPQIGYHRRISAEGLLSMNPSQVIGSDEMGPGTAIEQLKKVGVQVDVVNTTSSINGLLERIDQIAVLTHTEDKAVELKQQVSQQAQALAQSAKQQSDKKKMLFLLIHEGRPTNVAGSETTPDAIIKLAGGINPAADKLNLYKPLSMESLVEMQPDVILVSGRSYNKLGGADEIMKALPMLAATPAGQNKQIITIDGHALVGGLGLKSLNEAHRLNQVIYPD
ncbi:heme/hemin ABC transporter substrate-binding protein [Vibrio maerlii]|uniref:heme/hemin ABC transporter substrate-binding protein n=1 Tax=Vibrio maerlii TaxID=2231648 RepID=UPI000E3C8F5E|nr:ABC transporter substrate-binding protein [Vibrio maerlii]